MRKNMFSITNLRNHFTANIRDSLLRGGRLTKWKGKPASHAPATGARPVDDAAMTGGLCTSVSRTTLAAILAAGGVMATPASAADNSITVNNTGPGDATATTTEDIVATGDGIRVSNGNAGNSIDITASHNVTADLFGIFAYNLGSGVVSVTASGTVTGSGGDGIYAYNGYYGTNLIVDANDVEGSSNGIDARNYGTGVVLVTATGTVTGSGGDGIYAYNGSDGTDLTVITNNVNGYNHGIDARNVGSGALVVTATGTVAGTARQGIRARTTNGTSLMIDANNVSGNDGIYATNNGTGALSITTTGTVTGGTGDGIFAFVATTGTDLIIEANNVAGGSYGISAINSGTGALSVTTSGTVTGTGGTGIRASNASRGTNLTIRANNDVSGGRHGIFAYNNGTGTLLVEASGDVTGNSGYGIYADDQGAGLTVDVNNVTGSFDGIYARKSGVGTLTITSSGYVAGASHHGISAFTGTVGTGISIDAHDVFGREYGIDARNIGAGPTNIFVDGRVSSVIDAAIRSNTYSAGRQTNITLNSGANVSSTSGQAILNDDGDSLITINEGSTISGSIILNGGTDIVTFAGGDISGLTMVDGGEADASALRTLAATADPVDILNFDLPGPGEIDSSTLVNFEQLNINSGTLRFTNSAITIDELNINNGGRLDGGNSLTVNSALNIAAGGHLFGGNAAGGSQLRILGNLSNAGSINLGSAAGSSAAGDRLTLEGDYVGIAGSLLIFDVALGGNDSAADQLVINGNVSGNSGIVINNVAGNGGTTGGDGIEILQVNGNIAAGAFTLAGPVNVGGFTYDLAIGSAGDPNDGRLFLQSNVRAVAPPIITIARASQEIGLAFLGTVNERTGEIRSTGVEAGSARGIWGRVIGKTGDENLTSSAIGDLHSESNLGGLQLGFDAYNYASDSGAQTNIGVYTGYAWSNFDDYFRASPGQYIGTTDSDGWLAGIYATHYIPSGLYINAVVQGVWLDHDVTASDGTRLKTDSSEYTASLEVGQSFKLAKSVKIEPQVQLIYGTTDVDDGLDNAGVGSELDVKDTLTGRTGFRLVHNNGSAQNGKGHLSLYSKANLWHRLTGGAVTAYSTTSPINVDPRKTWADVGAGIGYQLSRNITLFADSDVEFGLDKKATFYTGKLGFRINW